MSFNTALSGLNAASADLRVTGQNIANASTVGFKLSRAEFADVYASSLFGAGNSAIGSGVKLANVAQQFDQGTISFTNNTLDLAIDGAGFFIVDRAGTRTYTRAGEFSLDKQGALVAANQGRVQGFSASANGTVGGTLGDIKVGTADLQPRLTSVVDLAVNLDARSSVLSRIGATLATTGSNIGIARAGTANGYAPQSVDVVQQDGTVSTVNTAANATAAQIATQFSSIANAGVRASASNAATLPAAGFSNVTGTLALSLNGVDVSGASLAAVAAAINAAPGLAAVAAVVDTAGDLQVTDRVGGNLAFSVLGGGVNDGVRIAGASGAPVDLSTSGVTDAVVGGSLNFTLDEGIALQNANPADNLFGPLTAGAFTPFTFNGFDATNPETYNAVTSVSIFDSLGNAHTMNEYFVRERPGAAARNIWSLYVQIDGQNVGDPDLTLPAPQNTLPTLAKYRLEFNPDGTLNNGASQTILISNWTPRDAAGAPNGALGPINVASGAGVPLPDPPSSSDIQVRLADSTQYGSSFGVNTVDQNGFNTGRLSGLSIDKDGTIKARFTNGQNKVLGEVALADFANPQGLTAVGGTSWAESNQSGLPRVGQPGSASRGLINSGALEDSNVDLSAQLVQLIIAQRNFQANAKTITTNDQITQTIIQI